MTVAPIPARVDVWELRCRFNRARYWRRQQAGEFTALVWKSNLARPGANQPPGTLSQEVSYLDRLTNDEVARVHQYLLPSGTTGASGWPDPKRVYVDGVLYQMPRGVGRAHEVRRDPSLRFLAGPMRSTYIVWRRLKCLLLGR